MIITDLFHQLPELDELPVVRAIDLMSTPVIAVAADAPVDEVADAMLRTGFTTLPVVDAAGRLVKLVTEDAVAKAHLVQVWAARANPAERILAAEQGASVFDFAVAPASVELDSGLTTIIETMLRAQLRAIPVVDEGRPVGMISWRDVLATIARSSASRAHTK
jgi:CBS domain-containing protein